MGTTTRPFALRVQRVIATPRRSQPAIGFYYFVSGTCNSRPLNDRHRQTDSPKRCSVPLETTAVMGGKKAVAPSQCRFVVVNGMPSMNRWPMDHQGRLATGLTVWSPGRDSPGVSFSSSSLGMVRSLGPSPDVDIPRLYNVYSIPQCDSPGVHWTVKTSLWERL